jgi:hypothetical protein
LPGARNNKLAASIVCFDRHKKFFDFSSITKARRVPQGQFVNLRLGVSVPPRPQIPIGQILSTRPSSLSISNSYHSLHNT